MWRLVLEEAEMPLEVLMGALGIPLWDKDLGRRAMYALEALVQDLPVDPARWDLPGEVRSRVEGLAELLLYLGAEKALVTWVEGYRRVWEDLGG